MNHTEAQNALDQNVPAQPRWPWFAAGVLLFASAALAGVSVHLHWVPCQGSMLDGTMFAPAQTTDLTDACLKRMDSGLPFDAFPEDIAGAPPAAVFGGLAMFVAAMSWIVAILGLRLRRETTRVALIAAVAPMSVALLSLAAVVNPDRGLDWPMAEGFWVVVEGLWFVVDAVPVVVFVVLWVDSGLGRGVLVGLAVVLWGATAFGPIRLSADFFAMMAFNEYNWDVPPGTGWITVGVLLIAGCVSFGFGGRRQESPRWAGSIPART